MQVDCPTCGERVHSDDMNLANLVAKCRRCHALVPLTLPAPARLRTPAVPQPPGFAVADAGGELAIAHRWFTFGFVFLACFCVAWDSFLIFWYSQAFGDRDLPWLFFVFPIVHVAVGVGLTYFTLAGFLNRTVVSVAGDMLRVRHGPLPWFGNVELPVSDLDQLYVQRHARRLRRGIAYTYSVNAATKAGWKVVLVSRLDEPDHAKFIEQRVEAHLGLEARPVPGEYGG